MLALKTKIWSVKKKRNSFPDLWMAYQVLGIKWVKKIKIFKNSAFDKKNPWILQKCSWPESGSEFGFRYIFLLRTDPGSGSKWNES